MAIILAAEIAICIAMYCIGHKAGYQKAMVDWHIRKGQCGEKKKRPAR